jgi:PAS domain-containing protein
VRGDADNVPAMTASLDEKLRYLFVNKRYADFFGVRPEEIVGNPAAAEDVE